MRIAVCRPQVPFARGGVEIFTDDLVAELRRRGHDADLVTVPFKWYPGERVLTQAFLWRLLDLEEADGRRIELVIATKFPSYVVRHPNKVVWLVHQFRQAYELDRTELGQFGESPEDRALRRRVQELDRLALGEARKVFATSRNVADRLERSTGIAAEVMPHPPQELPYRCDEYGDFVLSVGRLDRAKRIDLLIEAAQRAGHPGRRRRRRARPRAAGVARRRRRSASPAASPRRSSPTSTRAASPSSTRRWTRTSGWCPYEAFLAEKPVVTTTDAGGPLEIVTDRATGLVCEPRAEALAAACEWLRAHPRRRARVRARPAARSSPSA